MLSSFPSTQYLENALRENVDNDSRLNRLDFGGQRLRCCAAMSQDEVMTFDIEIGQRLYSAKKG